MAINNSPSFRYKQLNPAYQSDPRRILGQQLMQQGNSFAPVATPLQGLGRLSSALVGAYLQKGAMDRQVTREEERTNQIMGMIPANASPEIRAYAQSNPEDFMAAFGQSMFKPTSTTSLVTPENQPNFRAIQREVKNPITGETSTTLDNLTQVKAPTKTSLERNAILAGLEPGTQPFKDFITKNSSRQTNINMNTSPGSKSTVKRFDTLSDKADISNQTLNKINELEGYLANGVETGFGVETVTNFNKVRQYFNPDYKIKEIAGVENFNATATQLVMPLVKQLGVNPTDNDLKMTEKGAATLGKTTAGNRLILKTLKVANARQVLLFDELRKFISLKENENIENEGLQGRARLETHLKKVYQTHPLFTQAGKLIQEEYMSLTGNPMIENKKQSKIDALINSGDITK